MLKSLSRFKGILKGLVSVGLIALIFHFFPVKEVGDALKKADLGTLVLCLSLGPFFYGLLALRLQLLLKYLTGVKSSFRRTFLNYLYASAAGYWLPSSFGMDAALVLIHKDSQGLKQAVSAVAVNRLVGMASVLLMGLLGLLLLSPSWLIPLLPYACAAAAIGAALLIWVMNLKKDSKLAVVLREFLSIFYKNPLLILLVLALSFMNNLLSALSLFLFAKSLSVAVPFLFCTLFVPFLQLVTLVPVSFANIGVQDVSFVAFFSKFTGAAASQALGISIVVHLFNVLYVLIALVLYNLESLFFKNKKNL